MCGRYRQGQGIEALRARFKTAPAAFKSAPRMNLAPSEPAPVVVREGARSLELFRWGLVPPWDPAGRLIINARAETAHDKPSFKRLAETRRCLVPADGFYEWTARPGEKKKVPIEARLRSGGLFAMAGLWDESPDPKGRRTRAFAILTVEANAAFKAIHERMPAILAPEAEEAWLDPAASWQDLAPLLSPCPPDWLVTSPAPPLVPGG